MQGASAELVSYALTEWIYRQNIRAERHNRTGGECVGHADTWILDAILRLQKHVFGERVPHHSRERAAEYAFPTFYCGVKGLAPDVIDECGLPGAEMIEQINPLMVQMSQKKRYLAKALVTRVPVLPVHTKEEKIIYMDIQLRLRHEKRRAPTAVAMANAFNKAAADERLRNSSRLAARKDQRRGRVDLPDIFFKTVGHMQAYEA